MTRPALVFEDATQPPSCPACGRLVGDQLHTSSCRIVAETISHPYRQALFRPYEIMPDDLVLAGCGCSLILVDALGPNGGHHRPACRRTTWVTTVTRPDYDFPDGARLFDTATLWTACWTDTTVSRHGIHLPRHSTAWQSRPGFRTWDGAATFLDALESAARPLGVFLHTSF